MATVGVEQLGILEPAALTAKALVVVAYGALAYLLLLSSFVGKKRRG
jgi:hypothetical protein